MLLLWLIVLYPEPALVCLPSVVAFSCPTFSDEESDRKRITMKDACYIKDNDDSLNSVHSMREHVGYYVVKQPRCQHLLHAVFVAYCESTVIIMMFCEVSLYSHYTAHMHKG